MSGLIGQIGANSGILGSFTASTQLDYEEGTWTPVIHVNSGTPSTSQTPIGRYTKIGHRVIAEFYVNVTVSSASGVYAGLQTSGLPFTPKSETLGEYAFGGFLIRANNPTNEQVLLFNNTNPASASIAYFMKNDTGGGATIASKIYAGFVIYRI